MTPDELTGRIAKLVADHGGQNPMISSSWDDARAHIDEDEIYADVLKAVAYGDPNSAELARLALSIKTYPFDRWYE